MTENTFIKFSPKAIVLFFISLMVYVASSYYKTTSTSALFKNREENRRFTIKLSQSLHDKAGLVVANSNFDPIMPVTFLRILLRMPDEEVVSYEYDGNLIITTKGKERVIDVRDIVNYARVSKNENQYTIYLD